jgi:hypothetical protein
MAKRKFGMVEYERQTGENFDILRFSLKVPKPRLSEETRHHLRSAESEMLLAARTLIDELVEHLGRYGTKGTSAEGTSQELRQVQ